MPTQEKSNPWTSASTIPTLAEGTAGIKVAGGAEKAAAVEPEALEPMV